MSWLLLISIKTFIIVSVNMDFKILIELLFVIVTKSSTRSIHFHISTPGSFLLSILDLACPFFLLREVRQLWYIFECVFRWLLISGMLRFLSILMPVHLLLARSIVCIAPCWQCLRYPLHINKCHSVFLKSWFLDWTESSTVTFIRIFDFIVLGWSIDVMLYVALNYFDVSLICHICKMRQTFNPDGLLYDAVSLISSESMIRNSFTHVQCVLIILQIALRVFFLGVSLWYFVIWVKVSCGIRAW